MAIALGLKGLEVDSVVISYEDRSPVVAVSGQGLVPVIVDEGEVVADSIRILRHLDERYPEPRLFPADPARRADARHLPRVVQRGLEAGAQRDGGRAREG